MRLHEEFKEYENLWDDASLTEDKEFRSEWARLKSTEEGRAELDNLFKTDTAKWRKLRDDDAAVDPVAVLKKKIGTIELEYDGFKDEWSEMVGDPGADYGYYERSGSRSIPDYTYRADIEDVLEVLDDLIYDDATKANHELVKEYKRLRDTWEDALESGSKEAEAAALETWELFTLNNIYEFVELFGKGLLDHFSERAEEYAREHVDPYDEWDVDWEED